MVGNCPEWEFSGGQLSGLAIVRVGIVWGAGAIVRVGNSPEWEFSGGQLSWLAIVRVGIVWGAIVRVGNCPGEIVRGVIVRGDSSRGELSGNRCKQYVWFKYTCNSSRLKYNGLALALSI